jgi:amino acid transporter
MNNTQGAMPRRQLTLLPLIAAIFFMVSGGPYGLEEIIQKAGYSRTILILALVPFIWSVPVALMVGELSAALPEEGGYYAWVRRAMGPFWGFQEAWLSLAASIFDMAIYPTLFVLYMGQLWPAAVAGHRSVLVGGAVVAVCAVWNIAGIKAVGDGVQWMMFLLLAPFVVVTVACFFKTPVGAIAPTEAKHSVNLLGGIVIAMWNYMGWDNASTVAGEVENPQRNYPLALFGAVALIATSYIVPIAALWHAGIDASGFTTGSWVQVAKEVVGPWLGLSIVVGGMICGLGMNNALVLSYSRVPFAMAQDGMMPKVFAKTNKKDVPWVSVVVCAIAWTACLPLGFDKLIAIDILVYSLSLLLEFVALMALRVKEPELVRPFKIAGGMPVLVALMLGPTFVLALAFMENGNQYTGPVPTLVFGALVVVLGVVSYTFTSKRKSKNADVGTSAIPEN